MQSNNLPICLQHVNLNSNNLIVWSSHIALNGNNIPHDSNSTAYSTMFTVNANYLVVFARNPHCIQIINTVNFDLWVIRGFQQIMQNQLLAVSVVADVNAKTNNKNLKYLYLILDDKGTLLLQVIQFEPKIDNNAKTRTKIIQQMRNLSINPLKMRPIFTLFSGKMFMVCKKQLRVCFISKRQGQLAINFSNQNFQKNMSNLYSNFNLMGIAESEQTFAFLCCSSQNNSSLSINIFWQHRNNSQLSNNLYYRDDSFIKTLSLPCVKEQFIKIWQHNGFYLIQTQNNRNRQHQCHILQQKQNSSNIVTLSLTYNSKVCPYSLTMSANDIQITQIINSRQLHIARLSQKQQQKQNSNKSINISINVPTNKNTSSTNASVNVNSNEIEGGHKQDIIKRQQSRNVDQPNINIKRFQPVQENGAIHNINTEHGHDKSVADGKNTVKKQENKNRGQIVANQANKSNQIQKDSAIGTNFINKAIVDHLSKNNTQSYDEQDIEVPDYRQRLISFGTAGQIKKPQQINTVKNQPLPGTILASFGAGLAKKQKQVIPQPNNPVVNKQIKEIKQISRPILQKKPTLKAQQPKQNIQKKRYDQIRQKLQNFTQQFQKQLEYRAKTLNNDYQQLNGSSHYNSYSSKALSILPEPAITIPQYRKLKKQMQKFDFLQILLKRKQFRLQKRNKQIQNIKQEYRNAYQSAYLWMEKLGVKAIQQRSIAQYSLFSKMVKKNKVNKQVNLIERLSDSIKLAKHRLDRMYQNVQQKRQQLQNQYNKLQQQRIKKIKQTNVRVYSFNFTKKNEKIREKLIKIPIFRVIRVQSNLQPKIKLKSLSLD